MRIGIDASRAFTSERTGTENYSFQIIKHLLELPEAIQHEWILYTRQFSITNYQFLINSLKNKNLKLKIKTVEFKYLWTQLGLALHTWTDGLDVLWVPAHTLPLLRRGFGGLGKPLKTVVTIHGIEYEFLPAYENLLQRWYLPLSTQYAVRSAQKIIAVSQFTKRQLIERLGADSKKIEVVYEGTPHLHLPPKLGGRQERGVLEKYHLHSKSYILFIGTVQPRKNLARLIKAFNHLTVSTEGEVELVLVGKLGWGYSDLPIDKPACRQAGVHFLGYIDDAERDIILQNALVYVQPSITEGFGLPILEAFAAGVPVVSSSGGALPEVVGEAGLLFDPMSVTNIKQQISVLISDPELRNSLIAKGKKQLAKFSWQKAAQETYKILTVEC